MEACHSVTTPCCHRCSAGQSTELLIVLRTSHSKIIEVQIHLLRKLNSSLRRGRAALYATSVAPLPVQKRAEDCPAAAFAAIPVEVYNYAAPLSTLSALWCFLKFQMLSHSKMYLQNLCRFLEGFLHQNRSLGFLQSAGTCRWNKDLCCCCRHRLSPALTSGSWGADNCVSDQAGGCRH